MNRREFLGALSAGAAALLPRGMAFQAHAAGESNAARKPNFVLLVADDLTWHDIGCYGGRNVKTPNIDSLARDGMKFNLAFTAASMCTPCRTMLYTGLFPVKNGAHPNHSSAKAGTRSIVHYLHDLGYKVVLNGKGDVRPTESFPFDRGNLEGLLRSDKPFCFIMGFSRPHPPWKADYRPGFDPQKIELPPYVLDTPETREALCRYYAEVALLDAEVGRHLDQVRQAGKQDNTLVLFFSEQGSMMPAGKWTCYEPGIHAGVLARWPARVKPGSACDQIVQYTDVAPTLVEAAGGSVPKGLDGKSFLDLLDGKTEGHWTYAYAVQTTRGIIAATPGGYAVRAIRDKRYKLILNLQHESAFCDHVTGVDPEGFWKSWVAAAEKPDPKARKLVERYRHRPPVEFYDLEKDPWEMSNLADDPQHKDVIEKMRRELLAWMQDQGDKGAQTENPTEKAGPAKKAGKKKQKDGGVDENASPSL